MSFMHVIAEQGGCIALLAANVPGVPEGQCGLSAGDWLTAAIGALLILQTSVLLLVLGRLNRLLKSIGNIGLRLNSAKPGSLRPGSAVPAAPTMMVPSRDQARLSSPTTGPRQNSIGMTFVWVPAGEFSMGSSDTKCPENEKPAHSVKLTQGFWMAQTPVTNKEYEQFDPDHRQRRPAWNADDHPAVCVTWRDATAFCLWLSQLEGQDYRLPTEAQWEYAARGGDGRVFPWGNQWDPHLCNSAEPGDGFEQTSPVRQFSGGASPFGVLDMVGNVWEWCADWFANYGDNQSKVDPSGPEEGEYKACRGGSWMNHGYSCRASMRARRAAVFNDAYIGFRVVCMSDLNSPPAAADNPATSVKQS